MSTSNQPQPASLRQRGAESSALGSGKEKAGGSGADSSMSSSPSLAGSPPSATTTETVSPFDLPPAPALRRRPLSKVLASYLTVAVVYSFSLYFAVTVGLPMLLADLRKKRSSGGTSGGGGSPPSSSPSPSSLPDPATQREAAVAAEPGIEGVDVVHEFLEVPVYPDEAEDASTAQPKSTTTLHLARAGVGPSRRAVLFLHGFPECWLSWRRLMAPLVGAGYEVAALDMRGYNLSGRPGVGTWKADGAGSSSSSSSLLPPSSRSLAAFDVGALAADARAAAVFLAGPQRRMVTLISHDWGGAVAWHAASLDSSAVRGEEPPTTGGGRGGRGRPLRLFDALVTMAIPHPLLFRANMGRAQARRSWYVAFFQSPHFPERMMAGDGAASIRNMLPRGPSPAGKQTQKTEADEIADAFTRPGAATAAINYYRASVRAAGPSGPLSRAGHRAARALRGGVDVPVLSLYAGRDSALGVELLAGTERFCHAGVEIKVVDSGHWIQLEKAEECAERTLAFLERTGGNAAKISS